MKHFTSVPVYLRHRGGTSPAQFIVVLADDLGYGDIGCYGNQIVKTPYLDRVSRKALSNFL